MADTYKAPNVKKYTEAMKKKAKEAAKIKAAKAKKKDDTTTVTTGSKVKKASTNKKVNATTISVDGKEQATLTVGKEAKAKELARMMRAKRAKLKKGKCMTVTNKQTGKKVKVCKK